MFLTVAPASGDAVCRLVFSPTIEQGYGLAIRPTMATVAGDKRRHIQFFPPAFDGSDVQQHDVRKVFRGVERAGFEYIPSAANGGRRLLPIRAHAFTGLLAVSRKKRCNSSCE